MWSLSVQSSLRLHLHTSYLSCFVITGQAEVSDMTVTGGKTEQSESNELQAESGTKHQARRGRILTDNKEKQKPRGGKILKESKKSGGTRTISVREWLRRGR